ncbi:MAG: hypothetical protein LDLANPLL_01000 [Turneriella sp.]|nr:hypothetical protein [Turneriella sp.]
MSSLPIADILAELKEKLQSAPAVLLTADTGSGKTTWLPLQLLQEAWLKNKKIIMLEPRRVAARQAAYRLAHHLNESVGQKVGYSVRFDSKVSADTRLEVVTEGVLARRIAQDAELKDVGLLIFDEFHERHSETDIALALALESIRVFRADLKLLVMSATIDTERTSAFLKQTLGKDIPVVRSKGTNYPVGIFYVDIPTQQMGVKKQGAPSLKDIALFAARQALAAHKKHTGDILVFLPGKAEIYTAIEYLEKYNLERTQILPLHGELSAKEQDLALRPNTKVCRIIFSTPIAESSITVDGLSVVIDSGLYRQSVFNPATGISSLETFPITQDSAVQRTGRAGRTREGVCYRLYSEADFKRRPRTRVPEILRSDLAEQMLRSLSFGAHLRDLPLLDKPSLAHLNEAERLLNNLGLCVSEKLTTAGSVAAKLPINPRLAAMLAHICTDEILRIAAELSEKEKNAQQLLYTQLKNFFTKNTKKENTQGNGFFAKIPPALALLYAYPDRVAMRRKNEGFVLVSGRGLLVAPSDALNEAEFILALDVVEDAKTNSAKLRDGIPITREDIYTRFKDSIATKKIIRGEGTSVREFGVEALGELILSEKEITLSEEKKKEIALKNFYAEKIIKWFDEEALNFCARIEILRTLGENFPISTVSYLEKTVDTWLSPFLETIQDSNGITTSLIKEALFARLSYNLKSRLDNLLPKYTTLPSGATHPISYTDGRAKVSVRIQEVFGLKTHPSLAEGKVSLTFELLSPAHKPIATTQNLSAFWKTTYSEVRKELRGRYPKHFWPEDPLSMQGTTRTKKAVDREKNRN